MSNRIRDQETNASRKSLAYTYIHYHRMSGACASFLILLGETSSKSFKRFKIAKNNPYERYGRVGLSSTQGRENQSISLA